MFLTDSFDDDKMYQVPEGWNIHSFSSLCWTRGICLRMNVFLHSKSV